MSYPGWNSNKVDQPISWIPFYFISQGTVIQTTFVIFLVEDGSNTFSSGNAKNWTSSTAWACSKYKSKCWLGKTLLTSYFALIQKQLNSVFTIYTCLSSAKCVLLATNTLIKKKIFGKGLSKGGYSST